MEAFGAIHICLLEQLSPSLHAGTLVMHSICSAPKKHVATKPENIQVANCRLKHHELRGLHTTKQAVLCLAYTMSR
jgi:hypothetical protein